MPSLGIAPRPGSCTGSHATPVQDTAPVSGVFPADVILHRLEIGIQAIQLSPYRTGPAAPRPLRLGTTAAFLGRGRLPGEVPFLALFPGSPLPNPPCEFPRHGLSGDYAVSNAAMCSA